MSNVVIKVEGLSKQYRLGTVGTGTLSHDLNRLFAKIRGKEDPYLKIGESNERARKGDSEYVWALKDVNFKVEKGEVLGIIGKNGAGKSTLLKILSQITKPTDGIVKMNGRVGSLLEVGTGFHPELTGRENIYINGAILGMRKWEIDKKFDEIVDFAGVERYIDTPVKRYSSGMMVRLGFSVAAHLEPEILIIDEVLAVGDYEFQKKCVGKMGEVSRDDGRTILFVSHNLNILSGLCSKAIHLKRGAITDEGSTSEVISRYLNEGVDRNGFFSLSQSSMYRAQVLSAQLLNENLHPNGSISRGEKSFIDLEVFFKEEVTAGHIAVIIYDNMNNHIVSLADTDSNLSRYSLKRYGRYKFRLDLPTFILNEGKYQIFCGIGHPGEDALFRKELFSFNIVALSSDREIIAEGGRRVGMLIYKSLWKELSD